MSRMLAMTLDEKLKMLCEAKGWTQTHLLKSVPGASKSSMSNWFKGKHKPDLESAMAMARILGVTLDYLADDSQDDPPTPPEIPKDEEEVLGVYRSLKRSGLLDKDAAVTGLTIASKMPHIQVGDLAPAEMGVTRSDNGRGTKKG